MCRFSDSLRPPAQPSDGLAELLECDDDFNWFDAIDELNEEELGLSAVPAVAPQGQQPTPLPETDSSAGAEQRFVAADTSLSNSSAACRSGDSSSYDLVEMFKQQVEQQPAVAGPKFEQGVAPAIGSFVGASPFGLLAPHQQQQLLVAAPYAAGAGMLAAPQLLAAPAAAFLPAAALAAAATAAAPAGGSMLNNNTVGTPSSVATTTQQMMQGCMDTAATASAGGAAPCRSGSATNVTACVRRPRGQKTQAEIDAAVERIKQKRRESAQRSRARKNDYMRTLELENQALKDEVTRLQQVLAAVQRTTFQQHQMAGLVQLGAM